MSATNADYWHNVLRAAYEARLMLEKTESLSNWTTQSTGNRANSYPVKLTAKFNNKRINVSLPPGWQPARIGAGYDDDVVSLAKGKASDIWSFYANRNTPNPERETLAFLGYCIGQILTGSMVSYENEGKVVFAKTLLENAKYQEVSFVLDIGERGQVITYDLKGLNTLIAGLMPCPERFLKTSRKTGSKAIARLDIAEKPIVAKKVARKPSGKKAELTPPTEMEV